jgi:hypothetical protein
MNFSIDAELLKIEVELGLEDFGIIYFQISN